MLGLLQSVCFLKCEQYELKFKFLVPNGSVKQAHSRKLFNLERSEQRHYFDMELCPFLPSRNFKSVKCTNDACMIEEWKEKRLLGLKRNHNEVRLDLVFLKSVVLQQLCVMFSLLFMEVMYRFPLGNNSLTNKC